MLLKDALHQKIWARALSLSIATALAGCGDGFHAIKPAANEDLVYRFNPNPQPLTLPVNFEAKPMPSLPPGSVPIEPFRLAPDQSPRRTVEPAFSATDLRPLSDGDVMLGNVNVEPYRRVGRLEMRHPSDPPGWGSTCTAQLIGDRGVLVTAAHCVFDRDKREWPVSMRFKLQYDQGSYTRDLDWECAAMVSGWPNGVWAYDYAFVKLRGTPPGGLGMTINVTGGRVDSVGYPKKYYDTQRLVHVFGVRDGNNPSGMQNDMGKGSSGGARILDAGGAFTDVISVNSFFYNDNPSRLYGPVFTAATMKVYEFAARSCRDSVPGGAPMAVISSLPDQDKYKTIATRLDVSPTYGTSISTATQDTCSCDGKMGYAIRNSSQRFRRLAGVQLIRTSGDVSRVEVDTQYIMLRPNESRVLGCARTESGAGQSCDVDNQYRVVSDRRLQSDPQMPKPPTGVTIAQALASNDIAYCTDQCGKNNNDVCLNLGVAAVPSLAAIAKFVDKIDGGSSAPNGVLAKKEDVIKEFGGDPAANPDICERSDITRVGQNVTNEGFGCILSTKEIIPNAGLRTRLNMRAIVRGTPSTWSAALSNLVSKPTTFFTDKELGPSIDFENEPIFTEKFGGDVQAASLVDDKQIVLATSNGCMIGHYRKP